jgi:hypothetical protein
MNNKNSTEILEAMQLAIPVFAEYKDSDPFELKEALIKTDIAPWLAEKLLQFMPLAFARVYMNGMGIKFADDYICLNPQTKKEILKRFDDEPVYQDSLEVAFYIINNNLVSEAFQAIIFRSCELNALNNLLAKGSNPENILVGPPVLFME